MSKGVVIEICVVFIGPPCMLVWLLTAYALRVYGLHLLCLYNQTLNGIVAKEE